MKKCKKAVVMLAAAILCHLWVQPIAYASNGEFSDVPAVSVKYDEIMEAAELGLFEGVSKGTFAPEAPVTNAMFTVTLSRLNGVQTDNNQKSGFSDVPTGKWYTGAAAWAKDAGIVDGTAGLFLPGEPVTRMQAAVMIDRYAQYAEVELPETYAAEEFTDASRISADAAESVRRCQQAGLLSGNNGQFDPAGTLTRAEAAAILVRLNKLGGEVPSLTVKSTIFGSADTGNKSTLKARLIKTSGPGDQTIYYFNEDGVRTPYEEGAEIDLPTVAYTGEAVLTLDGNDLDDSKIDSSKAVVKLAPGDGYYPEELVLKATTLNGAWKDGKLSYALKEGDLSWYTGDYPLVDFNSSREWSCFGGDGNGCHIFNFQVSGITYDGQPVAPAIFQVRVYIYGRAADDMAPNYTAISAETASSGKKADNDIQWTWQGEDTIGKPILCDDKVDNFFVTWPTGMDASGLTARDVTVTLRSQYGDTYQLPESKYTVFTGENETQIAVTFQHVAYTPVYTTMEIAVSGQNLSASKTYDVGSVYTYMTQQGGGGVTVDGTITAYSYYGWTNLNDVKQASGAVTYTLSAEVDGETVYYAEHEDGTAYLVQPEPTAEEATPGGPSGPGGPGGPGGASSVPAEAKVFDASGKADCNVRLIGNTVFATTRVGQTEIKTVGGKKITFNKTYNTRGVTSAAMEGVDTAPGFVRDLSPVSPNQMWAWSKLIDAGWMPDRGIPTDFPYAASPNGY